MNEEINEKDNTEITASANQKNEMARILLTRYLELIRSKGIECGIDADENGYCFLYAPVRGTEARTAFFTISVNEFEETYTLRAMYSSELLGVPETASLTMTDYDDAGTAADFAADFIWNCFSKEHMKYCGFEHITDQNLERYIQFLPEFFFDDRSKDYYAAGICLAEPDGVIPAGAAVYSQTGENLVIDHVMIHEDLRGIGLGTYLVNHIFDTAMGNNQ